MTDSDIHNSKAVVFVAKAYSLYKRLRNLILGKLSRRKLLSRGLFDENYYREQLLENGISPAGDLLDHYLEAGEALGLQPHPLFDPSWYLQRNADAAAQGLSALLHYCRYGSAEHRKPHILFDHDIFQASLPKTPNRARSRLDPISRLTIFGAEECTNPNALFDSSFYIATNVEIEGSGENPLLHYLMKGSFEGRSPSAKFDERWYREEQGDQIPAGMSALEFHLRVGIANDFSINQRMNESRSVADAKSDSLKTILFVAHSASSRIYGSERSLIDILSVIDRSKFRIVLALPDPSASYVEATNRLADKTVVCRSLWWVKDRKLDYDEVAFFSALIEQEHVDLVYTNTIMLREALAAARGSGIPAICHAREIITQDPDLIELIGETPEVIIERVIDSADYVIGNSPTTAELFFRKGRTFAILNAVDTEWLDLPLRQNRQRRLKVGMLSSNIPKKGVEDLYKIAKLAFLDNLPIDFLAFGPKNAHTALIEADLLGGNGGANLSFPGYYEDTREALRKVDVVVNLSRFAESFGRTAAEGMAARRPIIAYNRGALKDVVIDGETGFLITADQPREVLKSLVRILENEALLHEMAEAGRKHAEANFSRGVLAKKINQALELAIAKQPAPSASRRVGPEGPPMFEPQPNKAGSSSSVTVVIPNYNYEGFLADRINSILNQTRRPSEIIFLDDCSTDESISVAEELLSEQFKRPEGIPYRIIPNGVNRGVYGQWLRAVEEAKTDWIWIAEADDVSDPEFLELTTSKVNNDVNLIYTQSRIIDENGELVRSDFLHHTDDLDADRWRQDFVEDGVQEVLKSLAFRNTIPNTSAAIMRRKAISGIEDQLHRFRYVGDWILYAHLLRTGSVAYVSRTLNDFRRHGGSVTKSKNATLEYLVELANVREFISRHFPILPRHILKLDTFMNQDYRIPGWERNTDHPAIANILSNANANCISRKRIAIITTNNGSHNGGSEMLWQETAFALRQSNHDVLVLIKDWQPTPDIVRALAGAGVRVLFKEEDGFEHLILSQPDLTVVSIGDQDEGTEYYKALRSAKLPYVIVNQLTKEVRFWKRRPNKQKSVKQGYLSARKVFFTSKNNHAVMEDRLECKIPNAETHFNPYHVDSSKVPPYPETGIGLHIAVPAKLLCIHKGQDLLIEALKHPTWRQRNVHFNLYGSGPDQGVIEKAISDFGLNNLHLKGRVPDISEIWSDNHALLMPSRMEGLPIMVVSALISARMCIVTDIGGHAEVVRDNESGFIIADPNVSDLRQTLERAFENRHRWQEMGIQARCDILRILPEDPTVDFISRLAEIWG